MTSSNTRRAFRLTREDEDAVRAYWRFFEPRIPVIANRIRAVAAQHAEWQRFVDSAATWPPPQDRALIGAAIFEGHWKPYLEELYSRGARQAASGISYSAWLDMLTAYRDAASAELVQFIAEDAVERLRPGFTIYRGMNTMLDIAIETTGEAYLSAGAEVGAHSDEQYRMMFDANPLPMWMFDRETLRFVAVNDAAVHQYGYSRDEFSTMTLADIRPPEDVEAMRADVRAANGLVEPAVWRHRKKDGSMIDVEIRANDLTVGGRDVRLVLITDVSERERLSQELRKTEDQLRHAQKMEAIGRLAGGVAHDFNNVLTVIHSYSCLLEESIEDGDARRDVIEIRRAGERAVGITRQLLTLSRHGIANPRSIDLDDLIAQVAPMLQRLVGTDVALHTPRSDTPAVLADPGQIEQVLMNLAINARDAMPNGGRLTIETEVVQLDDAAASLRGLRAGRYVVVAVTDTGIGMDADVQRRIFEPFFTTKEPEKGTGLGLAIVHGIVAQAGGAVSIYSELGHGTTFRVHLPTTDLAVEPVQRNVREAPRTLPPLSVLVVDDHREVRAAAARILQDAGCRVVEASTADEARRVCVSHDGPIDVIVLDLVLSDSRGDLLIPQLRELRPSAGIVLMSGYPAGALGASGAAPSDLLAKPFSPAELRGAVSQAIRPVVGRRTGPTSPNLSARWRVLVADDDDALRRTVGRILRRDPLDVVEVENGHDALAALGSSRFDVVLSDVHMPDGDGLELLRAVRRVDLDIPVILMSGAADVETAKAAVEYGAYRYLEKPLETEQIGKIVQQAARAHALARLRREALSVSGAHAGAADRAGLEVRFEQALERLWMVFQPIIEAKTGVLFGVEALMRTAEPSMPNPPAVLDAASQLGRLAQVGRRIRALSAAAVNTGDSGSAVFVNLHPEDLVDVDLVDEAAPLTKIARRVILEVTERSSLESSPELHARLARLRTLGFRLALDDIGAGYSGLTTFTELIPEVVKIDMSLVRDVHVSALKQRTIKALCKLCHEVGCLVVAEGIETPAERDCVIDLGCDLLQGYLLGRPSRDLP